MDAKQPLPDFVIAGAMKCGTTTLHRILAQHPNIFLPEKEIYYFDMDEVGQHPDFFVYENRQWFYPNVEQHPTIYRDWYTQLFAGSSATQLKGDHSTTYLASEVAMQRLLASNPNVKVIVMLRDPTSRAYSHYWHLVRKGKIDISFEQALQRGAQNIIERSLYKKHLTRVINLLPRRQLHVVIFEEFIHDLKSHLDAVCAFLEIGDGRIDLESIQTHHNPARVPKYVRLQLLANRWLQTQARRRYYSRMPNLPRTPAKREIGHMLLAGALDVVNPLIEGRPPSMRRETREFLNDYFRFANSGLEQLLGLNRQLPWFQKTKARAP